MDGIFLMIFVFYCSSWETLSFSSINRFSAGLNSRQPDKNPVQCHKWIISFLSRVRDLITPRMIPGLESAWGPVLLMRLDAVQGHFFPIWYDLNIKVGVYTLLSLRLDNCLAAPQQRPTTSFATIIFGFLLLLSTSACYNLKTHTCKHTLAEVSYTHS